MSGDFSILELFRQEVETQSAILTEGMLTLEKTGQAEGLEALMRAAHSLKGAARLTGVEPAVRVAHAMEDVFEGAMRGQVFLGAESVDGLLAGVDFIVESSRVADEELLDEWAEQNEEKLHAVVASLEQLPLKSAPPPRAQETARSPRAAKEPEARAETPPASRAAPAPRPEGTEDDKLLRLPTERLQNVMETTGELRVGLSWLSPFRDALLRLRHQHRELSLSLAGQESRANSTAAACSEVLSRLLDEFEDHSLRLHRISSRLRDQVLSCQMLPFTEGTRRFPRMVRDLARNLGKEVYLEILGGDTAVDRSILKGLEAPLTHLLRNSVDHGIESPEEREAAGKPPRGTIIMAASHRRGLLSIVVEDDGKGIDPDLLRRTVLKKGLVNEHMAVRLTEGELTDFLFLPRFTTTEKITEVSGRGVGLDAVRNTVVVFGGRIDVDMRPGRGVRFELLLPLSLSVIRALLVEVSEEAYALPLTRVEQILKVPRSELEELEGRQFVRTTDGLIGLVSAQQVLDLPDLASDSPVVPIILLGPPSRRYGLVVDELGDTSDLVVQALDPVLGKVPGVASGAVLNDGSPVLILDVEDVLQSIEKIVAHGRLSRIGEGHRGPEIQAQKHVLVVDDSVTVREVERKLLETNGYLVDVAVDGVDGWNALQRGDFDLVISDVDMPRMDGFRLVKLVRGSPELKTLPVIIVSYKDREEDRLRGLEVGADRYLTKGSFHDRSLLAAVVELIGEASS